MCEFTGPVVRPEPEWVKKPLKKKNLGPKTDFSHDGCRFHSWQFTTNFMASRSLPVLDDVFPRKSATWQRLALILECSDVRICRPIFQGSVKHIAVMRTLRFRVYDFAGLGSLNPLGVQPVDTCRCDLLPNELHGTIDSYSSKFYTGFTWTLSSDEHGNIASMWLTQDWLLSNMGKSMPATCSCMQ